MADKTTTARYPRTPEQQAVYDRLDDAWKIAARAIAADLPVHVPASAIRKALAANMREIMPLAAAWRHYEATMTVGKNLPAPSLAQHLRDTDTGDTAVQPIPEGVYWSGGNFYSMNSRRGRGQTFFADWYDRRDEFPTEPDRVA